MFDNCTLPGCYVATVVILTNVAAQPNFKLPHRGHHSMRNNPEERSSALLRGASLQSSSELSLLATLPAKTKVKAHRDDMQGAWRCNATHS